MPTVPTTFVPQVGPSGGGDIGDFAAPAVQPMANYTPEQVQQLGRATTQAGNVAFNIGVSIQDTIDEAETKASDVAFIEQSNAILRGQGGYLTTTGKQAEDSFQATQDALAAAGQQAMDRLQNDTQRRMFQNVLARNMNTAQMQVFAHRDKEVKVYATNESKTRAVQYVNLAVQDYQSRDQVGEDGLPSGSFNANLGVALNEARAAGRLMGFAEDSAQMRELENGVYTLATRGVVNRLMMDSDYNSGLLYVREQLERGRIDASVADPLIASLDANRKKQMVEDLTVSIKSQGLLDSKAGTANFGEVVPNARYDVNGKRLDMSVAPGTPINAPADGKIKSIDGNTVVVATEDGTEYTLSNVDTWGMLAEGGSVRKGGLVGAAGKDGEAVDGLYPVGYSIVRGGKAIDPRNANSIIDIDRDEATPPASLTEALQIAAEIPDPEMRRLVQSNLRQSYQQDKAIADFEYGQQLEAVEQYLARPDTTVAWIPPEVFGALKPKDQERLLKGQREEDEVDVMLEIAINPRIVTRDWLLENRSRMTRQTFIKLLGDVNSPDILKAAAIDADQLNAELLANGLGELVQPKTDEARNESYVLRSLIKDRLIDQQRGRKEPLDREEKRQVIDSVIMQYGEEAYKPSWWTDKTTRIGALTKDEKETAYVVVDGDAVTLADIPESWIAGTAIPELRKVGLVNPTTTQIAHFWLLKGKPSK
jgi:hypothetical protein